MKFIAERAGPVPTSEHESPVDHSDEFLTRKEVRAPSPRDFVNRRPPLPKFFRGPRGPDRTEAQGVGSDLIDGIKKNEMLYWDDSAWALLTPPPDADYKVLQRKENDELGWDWVRAH